MPAFSCSTWEPRRTGPSDCPDPGLHRYDLDVLSDDLRDVLGEIGIPRVHLWAGGFASYHALRFAARHPGLVGAVVTYNDVWAGDPQMAYDRIWVVYRTIVEQFGTTGLGARMLAGSFGVSDPPWFHDWETANIEEPRTRRRSRRSSASVACTPMSATISRRSPPRSSSCAAVRAGTDPILLRATTRRWR